MKLSTKTLVALCGLGVVAAASLGGCSGGNGGESSGDDASGSGSGSGGDGGGGGTTGSGEGAGDLGTGGGLDIGGTSGTGGRLDEGSACVATKLQANYEQRPADIIFLIDNSGSMTEEIESVQRNINKNFADIIEASGIDYRVIMISQHGSHSATQSVCVAEPLGSGPCDPLPETPNSNPPHFYQYNVEVESLNSLCLALDTLKGAIQPKGEAVPNGWSEWLRPDSLKVFVEITDDGVDCSTTSLGEHNITLEDVLDDENQNVEGGTTSAARFDTALTQVAPEFFGTPDARNYMFFSFVGIEVNTPATEPWPADQPVTWRQCRPGSVDPGTTYQALSVMTGGLRYPINQFATYDAVFQAIANSVISGAKLVCEIEVPKAPGGHSLELDKVQIEFTPSDGGTKQIFTQVKSPEDCSAMAFYEQDGVIRLCEDTCVAVRQDNAARMELLYGCSVNPD